MNDQRKRHVPSAPRAERFLGSFKRVKPCFKTLSERRSLSLRTRERYSQTPPPPFSTWFSSCCNCDSSVLLTILIFRFNQLRSDGSGKSAAGFCMFWSELGMEQIGWSNDKTHLFPPPDPTRICWIGLWFSDLILWPKYTDVLKMFLSTE